MKTRIKVVAKGNKAEQEILYYPQSKGFNWRYIRWWLYGNKPLELDDVGKTIALILITGGLLLIFFLFFVLCNCFFYQSLNTEGYSSLGEAENHIKEMNDYVYKKENTKYYKKTSYIIL